MRPKYALWLLVAAVSSTWYMTDPQAKGPPSTIRGSGTADTAQLAIANPNLLASPPRLAERSAL